jgi:hypothetical protein
MAFAVAPVLTIKDARWGELFSLFKGEMVIRNWNTDLINYVHVQKLDMFGTNGEETSGPSAAAWVA